MKMLMAALTGIALLGNAPAEVQSGLDVVLTEQRSLIDGKNVGVICNHTARDAAGEHIASIMASDEAVTLKALFGPEHGILGEENAGSTISDSTFGEVPIYSLYDSTRAPTAEELEGVDVLIYDIQDVGARYYTYISTMGLAMESCAANGVPMIVLDRPNPVSGLHPEGPLTEPNQISFVGQYPIPVRYSLTDGELAKMIHGEGWMNTTGLDLTIVSCEGWSRSMFHEDLGTEFIAPSPNIPNNHVALVYLATCYFEGTNLNEGRGTDEPFRHIGAPYVDSAEWIAALEAENLAGVQFEAITYTPVPNDGSSNPKLNGQECHGVYITVTDRDAFRPVATGLAMLTTLARLYPSDFAMTGSFNRLWGTSDVREALDLVKTNQPEWDWRTLYAEWETQAESFWQAAAPYRIHQ